MKSALTEKPDRLRAVFDRIDSAGEGSDIAFGIAHKALSDAGITWRDLLDAYLDKNVPQNSDSERFKAAFEGIFSESIFRGSPPPPPPPPARKTRYSLKILQGLDIPAEIQGEVHIHDRRPTQFGSMLVVTIETNAESFGPLSIFREADISLIDENPGKSVAGIVGHSDLPTHHPKFHHLRLA